MKRLILLVAVLSVGVAAAGWRGRFDEQFAAASSRWTPAALNPIAWYKGENDATDAMGNYNGTWVGTEAYADGVTGQALWHDNSYIAAASLTNSVLFAGSDREFTVAVWAKPVVPIPANRSVVSQSSGSLSISQFQMLYNTGGVLVMFCRGSRTDITGVSPGEWQHIAVTWDKTAMAVYIDGVLWGAGNVGAAAALPLAFFEIGARGSSGTNPFLGALDDVLIFDRALTAEEITKLYDETVKQNGESW